MGIMRDLISTVLQPPSWSLEIRNLKKCIREITDRYSSFNRGLVVFFNDTGVMNFEEYFLDALQETLL